MRFFLLLLVCSLPLLSVGQESNFESNLTGFLAFNENRILQLAEVFPAEKYDWCPSEGIRSVKETLLHVAQVNYMAMMQMGFQPEKEMDYMGLDKMEADKAQTIEIVKESFAFVNKNISEIPDPEYGERVTFPFGEFSKRATLMLILEHGGEHKGQLIAYARMNDLSPPWSN